MWPFKKKEKVQTTQELLLDYLDTIERRVRKQIEDDNILQKAYIDEEILSLSKKVEDLEINLKAFFGIKNYIKTQNSKQVLASAGLLDFLLTSIKKISLDLKKVTH
jgi:hypothetical protein